MAVPPHPAAPTAAATGRARDPQRRDTPETAAAGAVLRVELPVDIRIGIPPRTARPTTDFWRQLRDRRPPAASPDRAGCAYAHTDHPWPACDPWRGIRRPIRVAPDPLSTPATP